MACFAVTLAEAAVTTALTKVVKKKEETGASTAMIPFSRKLGWLNKLLWGGSGLLAFEHIWHGEVVPFFPFLTGAMHPDSAAEMLHEMATTGTSMAALVTLVWLGMVGVSHILEKRAEKPLENTQE